MVSTDTRDCVSYMGHRSVALTWSSVVDDRPDRPSQTGRRHRRNVWCECSSKSTHCSKVHGSYHPRTIGLGSFTWRPVWTRRASHPARSGRHPRGGAKVTWFRYSCEYRRYSREDARGLITHPGISRRLAFLPRVPRRRLISAQSICSRWRASVLSRSPVLSTASCHSFMRYVVVECSRSWRISLYVLPVSRLSERPTSETASNGQRTWTTSGRRQCVIEHDAEGSPQQELVDVTARCGSNPQCS